MFAVKNAKTKAVMMVIDSKVEVNVRLGLKNLRVVFLQDVE